MTQGMIGKLVSVLETTLSKLSRYDEGSLIGSILSFTVCILMTDTFHLDNVYAVLISYVGCLDCCRIYIYIYIYIYMYISDKCGIWGTYSIFAGMWNCRHRVRTICPAMWHNIPEDPSLFVILYSSPWVTGLCGVGVGLDYRRIQTIEGEALWYR